MRQDSCPSWTQSEDEFKRLKIQGISQLPKTIESSQAKTGEATLAGFAVVARFADTWGLRKRSSRHSNLRYAGADAKQVVYLIPQK